MAGEWLTYSLSDFLLFSPRTYYRLFELYNRAIWPGQFLAMALGFTILVLLYRTDSRRNRAIAAILAACWLWVAWAYLLGRYDTINWTARYLAAGFALQALLLAWTGLARDRLTFRPGMDPISRAGVALLLFALVLQPQFGPLVGRAWAQVELFGTTPDPTAVATLGLLLTTERTPWELLAIPLLWCAVSGATLWTMGSPDALVTPAAGLLASALATWCALVRPR